MQGDHIETRNIWHLFHMILPLSHILIMTSTMRIIRPVILLNCTNLTISVLYIGTSSLVRIRFR